MSIPLVLFVAIPLGAAFVLPLIGDRRRMAASGLANLTTGALLILALLSLGKSEVYRMGRWTLPLGINLVLDGLSGLMLVTTAVVAAAAMLFSVRYMDRYTARAKFLSLFLLMVTGMNGVILSGDLFNLFVFLEIASIASYALVGFGCEHEELEASFKYMVLGSVGSLFILFAVALTYGMTGALNMTYVARAIHEAKMNAGLAFALSLFIAGFGLKAALVPFHAWLPDAHPSAPAPISAMLSGVLIKALGVYGLARLIFNVFGVSVPLGWVLIALGVLSMVIGVFLAVGQWDFKRLLAYHSISQMGYVVLGFGIGALITARQGDAVWASLAILGGLFHLVNHAVFKSLLFLTSGSVERATGTRQLKRMGGLVQRLPFTGAAAGVASASIAGVPPFNGFWSKLILVMAAVQARLFALAAVTVLVSFVTLLSFLKVQRYVFLGALPEDLRDAQESTCSMLLAMGFLAVLCLAMSLLVLLPALRETVLQPAVDVLLAGVDYSITLVRY